MRRKYNIGLIRKRRTYTTKEIATMFGMCHRTVQHWITKDKLQPIEGSSNPYLIYGEDLALFLHKKKQKLKCSLQEDEFYCLVCRCARKSVTTDVSYTKTKIGIGNRGKFKGYKMGKCEVCGTKLFRFFTYFQKVSKQIN